MSYAPAPNQPAPKPRSGTASLVVGIVLVFLSLFSFPRGVSLVVLSIVRPEDADLAESLGQLFFGTALLVVGIVLIVAGARRKSANARARPATAQAWPQQYPPAPPQYPGQQYPPAPPQYPVPGQQGEQAPPAPDNGTQPPR